MHERLKFTRDWEARGHLKTFSEKSTESVNKCCKDINMPDRICLKSLLQDKWPNVDESAMSSNYLWTALKVYHGGEREASFIILQSTKLSFMF